MASLPSHEATAREILTIFVERFGCRADHVLQHKNFLAVWRTRGLHEADFKPGMEHAAEKGWVEIIRGGDSFKLTALGFSEA